MGYRSLFSVALILGVSVSGFARNTATASHHYPGTTSLYVGNPAGNASCLSRCTEDSFYGFTELGLGGIDLTNQPSVEGSAGRAHVNTALYNQSFGFALGFDNQAFSGTGTFGGVNADPLLITQRHLTGLLNLQMDKSVFGIAYDYYTIEVDVTIDNGFIPASASSETNSNQFRAGYQYQAGARKYISVFSRLFGATSGAAEYNEPIIFGAGFFFEYIGAEVDYATKLEDSGVNLSDQLDLSLVLGYAVNTNFEVNGSVGLIVYPAGEELGGLTGAQYANLGFQYFFGTFGMNLSAGIVAQSLADGSDDSVFQWQIDLMFRY